MKRLRYIIRHFPNLATHICVEEEGKGEVTVETRLSHIDSNSYVRQAYRAAGIEPAFREVERHITVGPWVDFPLKGENENRDS